MSRCRLCNGPSYEKEQMHRIASEGYLCQQCYESLVDERAAVVKCEECDTAKVLDDPGRMERVIKTHNEKRHGGESVAGVYFVAMRSGRHK
jgi:hypothetical protein